MTVVDGSTRSKVITPYQTAERIAKDAGIALYPEDVTSLGQSSNVLEGAGLEMTIIRAKLVSFDLYGTSAEVRTQAATVGEFLREKDIDLGANGRMSPSRESQIAAGMDIRVWREGTQTVSAEEAVPFEVERIEDADREVGYRSVQTPGRDGKRSVSYAVTIINGVEAERTEIASIMLEEPVKQVEVIGTKPAHLPYTGGGTKTEWLAASNIPEESWGYADYMVTRESSWNPNAVNRSSGACGLAQALPCSKVGSDPFNPIVSLNWMNSYVNGRYGGWANAYSFWTKNHWY
ncbi:G5 domain-containing protein [Candidatus Saccharibacteria bacterium]|nr:G5 domain-containing protein [Candidatus Saccharibacteria bacterium]